jgi:hypothetical protein
VDEQLQCTVTKRILRRIISTQSGKYSVTWTLYICQLFNINIPIIYRPVNYSVVLLLIVDCPVWRIPNRNAAALLHNNSIRNYQLLDRQGTRVLHHTLWCYKLLHEALKFNFAPSYINKEFDYYTVVCKYYTTQVLESYTTTYSTPAYYTEALSTTLCPDTTPKLQLITSTKSTTPKRTNTTLPRATQLQLRRSTITQQNSYYTAAAPSYYVDPKYYDSSLLHHNLRHS